MTETFYVQINEENIITDIISYKYSNYKEVQINVPLPPKIASGCYRLVGNEVVYVPSLDNIEQMNKIANLEIGQSKQDEDILVNMLANTEIFEMVLGMMPAQINLESEGVNPMVEVYATLIIKGVKTIDDVPLVIREKVRERLIQLEVPVK